jgi:colanic acid biosynthesis glycosyl transferase WcaI
MKKRFLLIGYNFYPEPTGIGKYNGEMIWWLMERGYDCTVVTSYPYYPFWKVQEPYHQKRFRYSVEVTGDAHSGGRVRTYRCPTYIPAKPTGLRRMLLDFSFICSACIPIVRLLMGKRFDFVLTVAPSFQVGFLGMIFKRLHKAKLLYHIQDLQIEAARDLKMIKSEKAINLLFRAERRIFSACDVISSISEGMVSKITAKASKNVLLFPNWTDTRIFYPMENKASLRKQYGYAASDKIILYSGAIGEKQGLTAILKVAEEVKNHKHIKFIICGSGPYKEQLQTETSRLGLENVNFLPIQPFEKFNRFLNLADAHLVLQKSGANDLVMPSKLTTIFAVGGVAIITADQGSGLHSFIREHDIGILVEAENSVALKDRILAVINEDFSYIGKKARKYAESFLTVDKIMTAYETFIQREISSFNEISPELAKQTLSESIVQTSSVVVENLDTYTEVSVAQKS